jgi:lipopolysaccharide biosynthesis glycosyltransferase
VNGKYPSQSAFLCSKDSGDLSVDDQQTFNTGTLMNNDKQWIKKSPYDNIKVKLLEYIELREQLYKQDKCRLSWVWAAQ